MGYYVLELLKLDGCIEVTWVLHHYYQATCECGHHTKDISENTQDLSMTGLRRAIA
ncbi:MAG: hypothetical protein ACHBN1_36830 [Heteroscytonema crispum UTEX LB 1556]